MQLTPADYVQAYRLHRLRSSWAGRHASALIILAAVAAAIAFIVILGPEWWHFAVMLSVIVLGGAIVVDRVWVALRARRAFRQRNQAQQSVEFTESGMRASGDVSRSWSDIPRWMEGELLYLIYLPDGTYRLVPKRFMPDATVLGEVLRTKVGAAG